MGRKLQPSRERLVFLNKSLLIETEECIMWPFGHTRGGYAVIWYENQTRLASQVVCEKVHGPPPSSDSQASHSCGRGHLGCVNWKHLSWKTRVENIRESYLDGNRKLKLTKEDVLEIRKLARTTSIGELSDRFRVGGRSIRRIIERDRWDWLVNPDFKYKGRDLF